MDKLKNQVLVIVIGPPKSGKSALAADIVEYFEQREDVEHARVFTTNDYEAFGQVQRVTDKAMVES